MADTVENVYQRINKAAKAINGSKWKKDMSNSAYKSVDIDQIRQGVSEAEDNAGLVVLYTEDDVKFYEKGGKTLIHLWATLTYINADNPEDFAEFKRSAVAFDSLDKDLNKAESILYKNHYKGLYHIGERSEDTDAFSNEEIEMLEVYRELPEYRKQFDDLVKNLKPKLDAKKRAAKNEERRKATENDPFFNNRKNDAEQPKAESPKEKVVEEKKPVVEKKVEPTPKSTIDDSKRPEMLKTIAEMIKADPSADWIARSFLGKHKTFSELPTDTLSEIVAALEGMH